MSNLDPDLSYGECWYARGESAASRFIPCGNVALGHKSCCESLDMCLSSHACYNGQYGVTYLAGCTDREYQDPSCPNKGDYADQPWAGLVYCNGTSDEWVACQDSGSTVGVPAPCWCPSTARTVAFTDSSKLADIMSLPVGTGQSVTWRDAASSAQEHSLTGDASKASSTAESDTSTLVLPPLSMATPTSTAPAAGSSSTSPPPATASPTPPSAIQSTTANPSASGLGTGQKIGIAIGSAVAALVLLLLAWMVFRWLRRRRAHPPHELPAPPVSDVAPVDPEMRSPAWSGHKSELAADESTIASPSSRLRGFQRPDSVEVEGSPITHPSSRPTSDGGFLVPGHRGTVYELAA